MPRKRHRSRPAAAEAVARLADRLGPGRRGRGREARFAAGAGGGCSGGDRLDRADRALARSHHRRRVTGAWAGAGASRRGGGSRRRGASRRKRVPPGAASDEDRVPLLPPTLPREMKRQPLGRLPAVLRGGAWILSNAVVAPPPHRAADLPEPLELAQPHAGARAAERRTRRLARFRRSSEPSDFRPLQARHAALAVPRRRAFLSGPGRKHPPRVASAR